MRLECIGASVNVVKHNLSLALLAIDSGAGLEVKDESETFKLGDKMGSKLEVRGGILETLGALQLCGFLRAWTCVLLHSRCEAGKCSRVKRAAEAWSRSDEVCVWTASVLL